MASRRPTSCDRSSTGEAQSLSGLSMKPQRDRLRSIFPPTCLANRSYFVHASRMSLRVRRTLGQMIDGGHTAMAECSTCHGHHDIDLAKLIEKVGRDYSLWNRRSPCRLTPCCKGYMVYRCGKGWPHLMADEEVEMWWVFNPIGGKPKPHA